MTRICKLVANNYGYPRWIYRVVECEPHQNGYLNERGVRLLWESEFCTYRDGSKDRRQKAEGERIAAHGNRCLSFGFDPLTPEGVLNNYLADKITV